MTGADPPQVTEGDIVNAVCMLVRAEVFPTIGLFDERFFSYHDETVTRRSALLQARGNDMAAPRTTAGESTPATGVVAGAGTRASKWASVIRFRATVSPMKCQ